jgi:hypothetical protein
MILPNKHLPQERALLTVGAELLAQLEEPLTISELWERLKRHRGKLALPISFDWFVLSLTFLYTIAAIEYDGVTIERTNK